jgi:hypothetical protein
LLELLAIPTSKLLKKKSIQDNRDPKGCKRKKKKKKKKEGKLAGNLLKELKNIYMKIIINRQKKERKKGAS